MTGALVVAFTDRSHGDLAVGGDPSVLADRRSGVTDHRWTWLDQVHGAQVVKVEHPGHHAGATADAAVTAVPGAALAVHTADCGPLVLWGDGVLGVAHVGWRGLMAGVVEATAAAMADLGGAPQDAVLGPSIRPRCYEFGPEDLDLVADRYGGAVRSQTAWGSPALDVAAGISVALDRLGVRFDDTGTCTACSPNHWSYRARAESGRQALVAWMEP